MSCPFDDGSVVITPYCMLDYQRHLLYFIFVLLLLSRLATGYFCYCPSAHNH